MRELNEGGTQMANNQIKVAACQLLTSEDVSANTVKSAPADRSVCGARSSNCGVPRRLSVRVLLPDGLLGTDSRHKFSRRLKQKSPKQHGDTGLPLLSAPAHHDGESWHNDLAFLTRKDSSKYRYGKTFLAGEKWCINNRGKTSDC